MGVRAWGVCLLLISHAAAVGDHEGAGASCAQQRDLALIQLRPQGVLSRREDVPDAAGLPRPSLLAAGGVWTGLIRNRGRFCLRAADPRADGGRLEMAECDEADAGQQWTFDAATGVVRSRGGKCLDAAQRQESGGLVHVWSCYGSFANQLWEFDENSGQLRSRDGVCLDSPQALTAGGKVHMWACLSGNANQAWTLVPLDSDGPGDRSGLIKALQGICLRAANRLEDGGAVQMWECDAADRAQEWAYDSATHHIRNADGKCLDSPASGENGGLVHLWQCYDGHPNQEWLFDGSLGRIRHMHGICLDAAQRSANGGTVHMWDCNGANPNQQWRLGEPAVAISSSLTTSTTTATTTTKATVATTTVGVVRFGDLPPTTTAGGCQTVTEGKCYDMIRWAMGSGIHSRPDWYPGLSASSTFEDFQAFFHKSLSSICPAPCAAAATAKPTTQTATTTTTAATTAATTTMTTTTMQPTTTAATTTTFTTTATTTQRRRTTTMTTTTPQPTTTAAPTTQPPATTAGSGCQAVTQASGAKCFEAVTWAMRDGIHGHPDWYPGLTPASTFVDFQALFYRQGMYDCPNPCTGGGTAIGETTTSAACAAVWHVVASDNWSSGTCGERVSYLERQGMTKEDALADIAVAFAQCEPCWPEEKYKVAGDTRRSSKRGVAVEASKLQPSAVAGLTGMVSWAYGWEPTPTGGPSLADWDQAGVHWVPMVWGQRNLDALFSSRTIALPGGRRALLGFNEPNFEDQANLTPEYAASQWHHLQTWADANGIDTLVSPAVNFNNHIGPIEWLDRFFAACSGCRVDAVAFHSYTCYAKHLEDHIDLYRKYGRPLWLTEFCCADAFGTERMSAEGQMEYMREAIPLLERDPDVAMYAWFSYFKDEWAYPIAGHQGDAGLVHPDGRLSELGQLYASFASSVPEDTPAVVPFSTTASPTCHTPFPGEDCYEAVVWAMTKGIHEQPDWYPGLSAASTFEDFQTHLHGRGNAACPSLPCEGQAIGSLLCHQTPRGCPSIGVNVFGGDGFESEAALRNAVFQLVANGVRNFRVVNVWSWTDNVFDAINAAAAHYEVQEHVSVHITSMFFDSPSTCLQLSSPRDFSIARSIKKLSALNVGRILVQLDACSICPSSKLHCANPTEQGLGQNSQFMSSEDTAAMREFVLNTGTDGYGPAHIVAAHRAFPPSVEFVIPYQDSTQTPADLLQHLVGTYIARARAEGRKFHLEGTVYPFWTGTEAAPFPSALAVQLAQEARALGFDGFVVSETGWARACSSGAPHAPATPEQQCQYVGSTMQEAEALARTLEADGDGELLVYVWKLGPADDGSGCGERSFGIFEASGDFACAEALTGWAASSQAA